MMRDPDELLRTRDVARMFDVTSYTVREWIRAGKLDAFVLNGQYRVRRRDALALAQRRYFGGLPRTIGPVG